MEPIIEDVKIKEDVVKLYNHAISKADQPKEGEDPFIELKRGEDIGFILKAGQNIDFIYLDQDDEFLYGYIAMPYGETNSSLQENMLMVRKADVSVYLKIYKRQLSDVDKEMKEAYKKRAEEEKAEKLKKAQRHLEKMKKKEQKGKFTTAIKAKKRKKK